jgi:hypothetical protein
VQGAKLLADFRLAREGGGGGLGSKEWGRRRGRHGGGDGAGSGGEGQHSEVGGADGSSFFVNLAAKVLRLKLFGEQKHIPGPQIKAQYFT